MSLDTNENMQCGRIARLLKFIGLIETTSLFISKNPLNTFITGRFQNDVVWLTPNLAPCTSSITPFSFRVGDYRAFIVDFQLESILGDKFIPMVKPNICYLISS